MRTTQIICPDCGQYLVDAAGMGETGQILICNNSSCPSQYRHIKCPKCESNKKDIRVIGLGHQLFRCQECGHQWSSLEGL